MPRGLPRGARLGRFCVQGSEHHREHLSLNKEGQTPRTKAPKIQCLVTPHVLQHKHGCIALKKQCTKKNKKAAAEYAQLLAKNMKEDKEKFQEQIAKRRRLSSLRASASESSQK